MTDEKKWYVMRVISGKERKIKEYIEHEVSRSGWGHIFSQVLVPTEKIYKVKAGKKVIQERNVFPGYILLEADDTKMNADMLQSIRNVSGVINFLGNDKPQALRKAEVNKILGKIDEMTESAETILEPYLVGESVKIIEGSFNDFIGVIDEINDEKKRLKVSVKIFGRKTPVDLTFAQVEKQA